MISGLGMAAGLLGGLLGTDKTKATKGIEGFDFSQLIGKKSDVTENGVNTSDDVSVGSSEALGLLREMTSGGLAGYFKWMVKQIREKVMESMGVSEESLAAMPAEQRDAVMKAIEEEVKQQVAKIMGVDPEMAGKMISAADKGMTSADLMEMKKAYKEDVPTV